MAKSAQNSASVLKDTWNFINTDLSVCRSNNSSNRLLKGLHDHWLGHCLMWSWCIIVLAELDVSFIETVLLAFPETEGEELTLEVIRPYWKAMEKLVHREIALSLGLADLDKSLLEQLYEWAEVRLNLLCNWTKFPSVKWRKVTVQLCTVLYFCLKKMGVLFYILFLS